MTGRVQYKKSTNNIAPVVCGGGSAGAVEPRLRAIIIMIIRGIYDVK